MKLTVCHDATAVWPLVQKHAQPALVLDLSRECELYRGDLDQRATAYEIFAPSTPKDDCGALWEALLPCDAKVQLIPGSPRRTRKLATQFTAECARNQHLLRERFVQLAHWAQTRGVLHFCILLDKGAPEEMWIAVRSVRESLE